MFENFLFEMKNKAQPIFLQRARFLNQMTGGSFPKACPWHCRRQKIGMR